MKEGDKGDAAYIILSGKVEIHKERPSETPKILAVLTRGAVVGELSLLDDSPHMASVIAVETTVVNAMSRDEFKARLESMDPAMRGIIQTLAKRYRTLTDNVANFYDEDLKGVNWELTPEQELSYIGWAFHQR